MGRQLGICAKEVFIQNLCQSFGGLDNVLRGKAGALIILHIPSEWFREALSLLSNSSLSIKLSEHPSSPWPSSQQCSPIYLGEDLLSLFLAREQAP